MGEPSVAARLLTPLFEACAKLSGPRAAQMLQREFAIDASTPQDPEARIPLPRFYDLLEAAAVRTGDDLIGMHYSLGIDPAAFDVLGFLAMTSPNLGVAFDRMFRYQSLLWEGDTGELLRAAGRVTIQLRNWGPARPAHRLWTEAAVVDMVVNGREFVGEPFEVIEIRLRHRAPSPDAAAHLRELLAAPLRFGAEDNAIVMPESVMALPLPQADPSMFAYFEREAARLAAAQRPSPSSLLEILREQIQTRLPEGVPELAELAAHLSLSPRTLQRRLADRGSSLRQLVDELRHELALRHLAAGLSIAEVSYLLGFSEPSAFHRAFRRWTRQTPRQWREHRSEAP